MFSVQDIINKTLKDEQTNWKPKTEYWQGSDTGKCLRMRFYKRLAIPYTKPYDERTLRVFRTGDIFHWWFQREIDKAGNLISKEGEVFSEDGLIIGHFDALVDTKDKEGLLLYDFKTKHSAGFKYLERDGADNDNKKQITLYQILLEKNGYASMENIDGEWCSVWYPPVEISGTRILYISKDDLRVMEFDGIIDKQVILDEYKTLDMYWKNKQLPPCTCKEKYNGKGPKYCNYGTSNTECCSENLFKKEVK